MNGGSGQDWVTFIVLRGSLNRLTLTEPGLVTLTVT
jgi:hypothetical protein